MHDLVGWQKFVDATGQIQLDRNAGGILSKADGSRRPASHKSVKGMSAEIQGTGMAQQHCLVVLYVDVLQTRHGIFKHLAN